MTSPTNPQGRGVTFNASQKRAHFTHKQQGQPVRIDKTDGTNEIVVFMGFKLVDMVWTDEDSKRAKVEIYLLDGAGQPKTLLLSDIAAVYPFRKDKRRVGIGTGDARPRRRGTSIPLDLSQALDLSALDAMSMLSGLSAQDFDVTPQDVGDEEDDDSVVIAPQDMTPVTPVTPVTPATIHHVESVDAVVNATATLMGGSIPVDDAIDFDALLDEMTADVPATPDPDVFQGEPGADVETQQTKRGKTRK